MAKYENKIDSFLAVSKALADETRVRALMLLEDRELCACQIIEVLGLAGSTVSKHMSILHQAGLVQRRKQGRWHYFQWKKNDALPAGEAALQWLQDSLGNDQRIADDKKKLKDILKFSPEELCCR